MHDDIIELNTYTTPQVEGGREEQETGGGEGGTEGEGSSGETENSRREDG